MVATGPAGGEIDDEEHVSPGDCFRIRSGYEGTISDVVKVDYSAADLERLEPEEGVLRPGVYHWDGNVVTYREPPQDDAGDAGSDDEDEGWDDDEQNESAE